MAEIKLIPGNKIKSRFPKKTIIKIPGLIQLVHHLRDLLISDTSSHTTIEDLARICSAPWRGTNLKMVAKSLRPFLRESSFDFPAQIGYNRKYLLICIYLGISNFVDFSNFKSNLLDKDQILTCLEEHIFLLVYPLL